MVKKAESTTEKKSICYFCSDESYYEVIENGSNGLCKFHNEKQNRQDILHKAFQLFVHNDLSVEESVKIASDFVDFEDKNKLEFLEREKEHMKKFKKKSDE